MKNTTKAILVILTFIVVLASCQKQDVLPPVNPINLGVKSTTMNFNSETVQNGTNVSFKVNTTPGSKYSFQIVNFNGDVLKSQGLVADAVIEDITLDVSKIESGAYDLIFMDTQGKELKQPLIIK